MSDEGAGDFLARLTTKLTGAGVPHMVVGSFASSFHGVPRSSQDLDLVIDPDPTSLRRFLADLPADAYYADSDAAVDAMQTRGQFNVIDMATAWKADLIVRKARPFSVEEMKKYGLVVSGLAETKGIGCTDDARQKSFFDKVVKIGLYDAGLDYTKAYTNKFVCKGVGLDLVKK